MGIIQEVFVLAAHDFRRTWRELLVAAAVFKVAAFVILFPLVGAALRLFVSISGSSVIADQDILLFFLSPIGLVALVVVSAVGLGILALEQACLMVIVLAATQNVRVTALEALRYGARHAGSVVRLAIRIVLRLLLVATPFLAAGGLVYLSLLAEFDINYYLTQKPPVFVAAVIIMGVLLVIVGFVLVVLLLGWVFALPLHLFEGVRPADALKASAEKSQGHRWVIGSVMVGWAVGSMLFSGLTLGAVGLLGRSVLPSLTGPITLLVLVMGLLVLLWATVNLIVTLFSFSTFALLIVRLYDRLLVSKEEGRPWAEILGPFGASADRRLTRKKLLAGTVVAALVAAILGTLLVDGIRVGDDVLIIAHRGAAGAAPENTLAAFERAIADGADYVELDVQENADGEVVVIHDSDLMKIGRVNLKIWDATDERLRDIDVGSWFSPEFGGERVPKLEQVLELCKDRARVNIELKYYGHDSRLEERVVEIVERADMESDIVVMSLKYDAIQKVRKLRPSWTLGLLTATYVGDLTRLDADFLAVHTGLVTTSFVRAAHRRDKQVYAWTVNDPVQMFLMMNLGVDGLITDEPSLARSILDQRAEMNSIERLVVELSLLFGVVPEQPGPETDAG